MTFLKAAPLVLVLLGVGSWLIAMTIDGGFFHGLFQGAAVGLVLLGVYFLYQSRRVPAAEEGMWRPSQEKRRGRRS